MTALAHDLRTERARSELDRIAAAGALFPVVVSWVVEQRESGPTRQVAERDHQGFLPASTFRPVPLEDTVLGIIAYQLVYGPSVAGTAELAGELHPLFTGLAVGNPQAEL